MATHVWSVACYKASLDRYTNRISLLDVVEEIVISKGQDLPFSLEERVFFPFHSEIVSLFRRSDLAMPERSKCRIELHSPDANVLAEREFELDFFPPPITRVRTIFRLDAFPYRGLGMYHWNIHLEKDDGWQLVAEVPVILRVETEADSQPAAQEQTKKRKKRKPGRASA